MRINLKSKKLKQNVFKVPDNYFETLTHNTLCNIGIDISMTGDTKKMSASRYSLVIRSLVAAAVVIIAMLSVATISGIETINNDDKYFMSVEETISDYSTITIESYIDIDSDSQEEELVQIGIEQISESYLVELVQE